MKASNRTFSQAGWFMFFWSAICLVWKKALDSLQVHQCIQQQIKEETRLLIHSVKCVIINTVFYYSSSCRLYDFYFINSVYIQLKTEVFKWEHYWHQCRPVGPYRRNFLVGWTGHWASGLLSFFWWWGAHPLRLTETTRTLSAEANIMSNHFVLKQIKLLSMSRRDNRNGTGQSKHGTLCALVLARWWPHRLSHFQKGQRMRSPNKTPCTWLPNVTKNVILT